MKKTLLILIVTITFFIQGCNATSQSDSNDTTSLISETSVLLPLYSYPTEWKNNSELTNLRLATRGQIISVINPSSGPGLSKNSDYVDGIEYLFLQNIKVIAYIYTSYGNRDKQEIYDDIDAYVEFYGTQQLTGVFFDEVSVGIDDTYMKDISEYAKSKGLDFIVLNPGTNVAQAIIDENYYDIIVTYENSYDNYINFENGVLSADITKQALLVYAYPNLTSYRDEIEKAKEMNFDYIYLTIDAEPNPWDSVFNFIK